MIKGRDLFCRVAVERMLISEAEALRITNVRHQSGKSFVSVLTEGGIMPVNEIANLLDECFGIPYCDVFTIKSNENQVADLINHDLAAKHNLLPFKADGKQIYVAMSDPLDSGAIDDVERTVKLQVAAFFADRDILRNKITILYTNRQKDDSKDAPAVKLVDSIIESAVYCRASDIHLEPSSSALKVRFRIDGVLKTFDQLDVARLPQMISRIKIQSGMDISEKRLPQDGHWSKEIDGLNINLRVSTIPTIFGEKAVIRLIYAVNNILQKEDMGFFPDDLEKIDALLKSPYGSILVTGPTGSGKSTTLAGFLHGLAKDEVNIVTVEDPVELLIEGATQININLKIGLDFNNILRFILRQDPDVIMIGEIRDTETAKTAVRAAITGHLVLATLHTNDAISTITRLIDMGVDAFLVPAAVKGVISQRLVRKICPYCKTEKIIAIEDSVALKIDQGMKVYYGAGCSYCNFTGYKGRFCVCEIMQVDYKIKEIIDNRQPVQEIQDYYKKKGMVTLRDNVLRNVVAGNTTIEEMYKVVYGN